MKKVLLLLTVLLFVSCATKTKIEYVDREVVKYQTVIRHDTLIVDTHDSVFFSIITRNDTVYITKYIEKYKWRDRVEHKIDTVYKDSIQVQVKENTVEKRIIPTWCYYTLLGWVVIIVFITLKIRKWLL